jgi:hypothetical protein
MRPIDRTRLADKDAWLTALQAASLGFVFLLTIGSAFVVAVKLQYPSFGAGADPVEIFTTVTIGSLAVLRAPVHIGKLTLTALPLGALIVALIGIAWATRTARAGRARHESLATFRIGLIFGSICCLMAIAFRYRGGPDAVHAGAVGSFVWGAIWGSAGAALGRTDARLSPRALVARGLAFARRDDGPIRDGIRSGAVMLSVAGVLSLGAVLVWMIGALASDRLPRSFGPGDALAGIYYFLAFVPNLMVAVVSVSLGASVDVGAQLTLNGKIAGSTEQFSMFGWGDGATPAYIYLLLLIPLVACVAGGFVTGATSNHRKALPVVTAAAALTFAIALALLAWLGEARLGASIVGARGFGRLSANPLEVFGAAFLWAGVVGGAAALILDRRSVHAT